MIHNMNNCRRTCHGDPCNRGAVRFWVKQREKNPDAKPNFPIDVCDQLDKECGLKPGSLRCYAYRCRRCKLWRDYREPVQDDEGEIVDETA